MERIFRDAQGSYKIKKKNIIKNINKLELRKESQLMRSPVARWDEERKTFRSDQRKPMKTKNIREQSNLWDKNIHGKETTIEQRVNGVVVVVNKIPK